MHKLGLKGIRRNKRKYSSYKGTIGKIAPNLIRCDFFAPMPNMKWYTDITEFHLNGEKLYLSTILDGCGGDIVSYTISKHPDMELVMTMLLPRKRLLIIASFILIRAVNTKVQDISVL